MSTLRLDTPIKFLKGIGERRAELFWKLGVATAQDLLWHLPHRYLDASSITPLAAAKVGGGYACIGEVVAKRVVPFKRLRVFRAVLRDDSGGLECGWAGGGRRRGGGGGEAGGPLQATAGLPGGPPR